MFFVLLLHVNANTIESKAKQRIDINRQSPAPISCTRKRVPGIERGSVAADVGLVRQLGREWAFELEACFPEREDLGSVNK
jgi:hypothetical protein